MTRRQPLWERAENERLLGSLSHGDRARRYPAAIRHLALPSASSRFRAEMNKAANGGGLIESHADPKFFAPDDMAGQMQSIVRHN